MDKKLECILIRSGTISWQILKILAQVGQATFETFIESHTNRWASLHDYPRRSVYNAAQRLKQKGYLKTSTKSGQIVFELTEGVKKQLAAFEKIRLKTAEPREWDGQWRLVLFDIPETQKKYRDTLRRRLKTLGLELFQQSIWLSPYSLSDDFYDVVREAGVGECVKILETDKLPERNRWLKIFNLDSHRARPRGR